MVNARLPPWEGAAALESAPFAGHIGRMRILFAAVLSAVALLFAAVLPAQAQGQVGVPEIEKYFNSIRTLKARFVQSNPNGSIVQGTLYVRRPGRMRFEYDPPSQLKIVADGFQVTMWDPTTKDFGQWPIGWTAASFLVKEPFSLSRRSSRREARAGQRPLEATMSQTKQAEGGQGDRPLCGKPADAARLDDHRQSWPAGHHRARPTCRPACSSPIRCSRTRAGADAAASMRRSSD